MSFMIPGEMITAVAAKGAGAPETGYYKAKVASIKPHPTRQTSRRIELSFETGFQTHGWLNSPYDAQGNLVPGMTENQIKGMVGAIKALFLSAGYTNEQMAQGVTQEWLIGREVYLEWHNGKDLGSQYGEIDSYLTPERYAQYMEQGKKPAIVSANEAPAAAVSKAEAPSNGAFLSSPPDAGALKLPPVPSSVVR